MPGKKSMVRQRVRAILVDSINSPQLSAIPTNFLLIVEQVVYSILPQDYSNLT